MLEATKFYRNLLNEALQKIEEGSIFISGKLGVGTRDFEQNLKTFEKKYREMKSTGETVFNQLPFLDIYLTNAPRQYEKKFEIFYKGIMSSGKISKLYVLKDSIDAVGVRAEIQFAKEHMIPVEYE